MYCIFKNIDDYTPPSINVRTPNPYVWLFYRQLDGEIKVADKQTYPDTWQFNVNNFAKEHNLEGTCKLITVMY